VSKDECLTRAGRTTWPLGSKISTSFFPLLLASQLRCGVLNYIDSHQLLILPLVLRDSALETEGDDEKQNKLSTRWNPSGGIGNATTNGLIGGTGGITAGMTSLQRKSLSAVTESAAPQDLISLHVTYMFNGFTFDVPFTLYQMFFKNP